VLSSFARDLPSTDRIDKERLEDQAQNIHRKPRIIQSSHWI
jgi:hypothetical protein